jgi:hypothetical protein
MEQRFFLRPEITPQPNLSHRTTQRTPLASSASTNPKPQSARSDSSTGAGGGGSGGGRGGSKGGGKGSDGIVPKPLTPAVGAPVDADLQVSSSTLLLPILGVVKISASLQIIHLRCGAWCIIYFM